VDWDKLRIFHAVADAGSLTHAGETLHLSQSAVSRQVRALEDSLDATLFHRHARGLILTEQGDQHAFETVKMKSSVSCALPQPPVLARSGWRPACHSFMKNTPT